MDKIHHIAIEVNNISESVEWYKKNTNWLSVVITVIPLMCKHEKNNLFFEIISQHDTHILLLLDTLRLQEQQKACHNDSKSYV